MQLEPKKEDAITAPSIPPSPKSVSQLLWKIGIFDRRHKYCNSETMQNHSILQKISVRYV